MELVAGLVRQCGGGEILKMGEVEQDGLLRARHPVGRFAFRPVRVQEIKAPMPPMKPSACSGHP
jgi:hypothetical protein